MCEMCDKLRGQGLRVQSLNMETVAVDLGKVEDALCTVGERYKGVFLEVGVTDDGSMQTRGDAIPVGNPIWWGHCLVALFSAALDTGMYDSMKQLIEHAISCALGAAELTGPSGDGSGPSYGDILRTKEHSEKLGIQDAQFKINPLGGERGEADA